MSNLFVNSAAVTANIQQTEYSALIPTADPENSQFSKTLAQLSRPVQNEPTFKQEPVVKPREDAYQSDTEQTQRKDFSSVSENTPKSNPSQPENKAVDQQNQSSSTTDTQKAQEDQPAQSNQSEVSAKSQAQDDSAKGKSESTTTSQLAAAINPLIFQMLSTINPPVNAAGDEKSQLNLTIDGIAPQTSNIQNVAVNANLAELVQMKMGSGITPIQTGVGPTNESPMLTDTKETGAATPSNLITGVAGQLNEKPGSKVADLLKGNTELVQPIATKAPNADAIVKIGEKQSGSFNADLLQNQSGKDVHGLIIGGNNGKSAEFNLQGTVSAVQLSKAGEDGKPLSLNMPLIQTQLSVNSSSKTQADSSDLAVLTPVNPQASVAVPENTGTVTTTHVNKDELFSQIVDRAKVMINNGNSEMEMSLKPEHLGKLQLKVSVVDQVVTAKFVAESQQVKEVLESHLTQLRTNLQESGMRVDTLMVSVGQHNLGDSSQEASQGKLAQNSGTSASTQDITDDSENNLSQVNSSLRETVIDLIA